MKTLTPTDDFTSEDLDQLSALVLKLGRAVIAQGEAQRVVRETAKSSRFDVEYLTSTQAARVLSTTVAALHAHVQRGNLKPDMWGGRGRFKGHRFTRATLAAFDARKS